MEPETLAQMIARLDEYFLENKPVCTFTALIPNTVTYETFRSAVEEWATTHKAYIGDVRYRIQPKLDSYKIVIGVASNGDIYRNRHYYE